MLYMYIILYYTSLSQYKIIMRLNLFELCDTHLHFTYSLSTHLDFQTYVTLSWKICTLLPPSQFTIFNKEAPFCQLILKALQFQKWHEIWTLMNFPPNINILAGNTYNRCQDFMSVMSVWNWIAFSSLVFQLKL